MNKWRKWSGSEIRQDLQDEQDYKSQNRVVFDLVNPVNRVKGLNRG